VIVPVGSLAFVRVLIVDDDADGRDLLKLAFEQEGAEARAVESSRKALEAIEAWRPQALISDIALPGEDGYDLIRHVRALGPARGGSIRAVALSGYASPEDRNRVLTAGFQMLVPKPVEPKRMIQIIRDLVAGVEPMPGR
jgi:CheY-like chemotaxis protein